MVSNRLFRLPIRQMQVFLDLPAFVAVFQRLLGLVFHLAERVAGISDDLSDGLHHFFHNAFCLVTELGSGPGLSLMSTRTPAVLHAPFMRPNTAFVIQNFQKSFLNVTKEKIKI